jgi:hypothetical protein
MLPRCSFVRSSPDIVIFLKLANEGIQMTTLILENAVRSVSLPGAASKDRAPREIIGVTGLFMDDAVPEIHDKRADNTARSVADRRRPGRQEYDTLTLIPLLRSPSSPEDTRLLFSRSPIADSVTGAPPAGSAVTGGGMQTPNAASIDTGGSVQPQRSNTVALPDGTRITFAAADWIRTLESA